MRKIGNLATVIILLTITSCIDHEVIPAPETRADLRCHFSANVNGSDTEFTENVVGYAHQSTKAKIILPSPSQSSAVYFSEMASSETEQSIKVGLGSAFWDAWLTSEPTLTIFNAFFNTPGNRMPNYSQEGVAGVEVIFRDATGREWKSSESSTNPQTMDFASIEQESDSNGDYSKFVCTFDCYVYSLNPDSLASSPAVVHMDSMHVQNATYRGWFQR